MRSRANLFAILFILICLIRVLESLKLREKQQAQKEYPIGKKIFKGAQSKIAPHYAGFLYEDKTRITKTRLKDNAVASTKESSEGRERPRRKKHKMDRAMMALLMAYKMKFIALIPTMIGGLILLKATALLAGFFFALFAAVLGLKVR